MALLTDLPPELISPLPNYLSSLDDWYALIRTSRYFYVACANTTARFPAVLHQRDGGTVLPPHPHMLLSGIARQIGDWAIQSDANRDALWEALDRGNVGLLDLGAQVARLSVEDVRALHRDRIEVVKPLAERVYRELKIRDIEERSPFMPGFRATPEVCVFNHVIYSGLFHREIDRILGRDRDHHLHLPPTGRMRQKWIERCMSSPKAGTSTNVGQDRVPSRSSEEHSLGSPTDNEGTAEDTIDYGNLKNSITWSSIRRFRRAYPETYHRVRARRALDSQGMDSLRLRLSLSNGDAQILASDAEEVICKAARLMTRLEEVQMELPRFPDLMEDLVLVEGR